MDSNHRSRLGAVAAGGYTTAPLQLHKWLHAISGLPNFTIRIIDLLTTVQSKGLELRIRTLISYKAYAKAFPKEELNS